MKILIINYEYPPLGGGGGIFTRTLAEELAKKHTVDVLTTPEPVESMDQLDPSRYGVIVINGERRGLLLPDLEGVDTVAEQLGIAMRKAGIDSSEPGTRIERFEVKRFR